jgi:hypothetical protein
MECFRERRNHLDLDEAIGRPNQGLHQVRHTDAPLAI